MASTSQNGTSVDDPALRAKCTRLRAVLPKIRGFNRYLALVSNANPTIELWDLFSLGVPLCYLFDLVAEGRGLTKIDQSEYDAEMLAESPERAKKHAIALFAMQIRSDAVARDIPGCEPFTVNELWDRDSTQGLNKAVQTVSTLIKHLPADVFDVPRRPSVMSTPFKLVRYSESHRINVLRELVETERKYNSDLEVLQKYLVAVADCNLMDEETISLVYPNVDQLVEFQAQFLRALESTMEQPWPEQRWGQAFLQTEEGFLTSYTSWFTNYTRGLDILVIKEPYLAGLDHLISSHEASAYVVRPVSRACKYPLLLDSLIKCLDPAQYPYFDELKAGREAMKRVIDELHARQMVVEKQETANLLRGRVADWKGHNPEHFGALLLDDVFVVTKSNVDREYHVFLFEKILLCCKEVVNRSSAGHIVTYSAARQRTSPLTLKGRIFMNVVTAADLGPMERNEDSSRGYPVAYPLTVRWKPDEGTQSDSESLVLRCRTEDQAQRWKEKIAEKARLGA
ncbi:Rho guanine nucleotide exchange factor scd1 [Mycena chlorophos]|uniref:Rho guanine nucleotide exchange factor scd1 n=1 Tax=Mycena chlorophos TaxID=658473 RepID=A0A8H6TLA0_MYCCL|nr:Rho guanine nucleotide exchange factor scd1 [Mycena chlorophos]